MRLCFVIIFKNHFNKIMKRKILFYDENIINGKQASKQAVAAASAKKENS